jgi:hypothetical protein
VNLSEAYNQGTPLRQLWQQYEHADHQACRSYQWLTMRSKLVPFVNVASLVYAMDSDRWNFIDLVSAAVPLIGQFLWQQQSFINTQLNMT